MSKPSQRTEQLLVATNDTKSHSHYVSCFWKQQSLTKHENVYLPSAHPGPLGTIPKI